METTVHIIFYFLVAFLVLIFIDKTLIRSKRIIIRIGIRRKFKVYKLIKNATFEEIFEAIPGDLDSKCIAEMKDKKDVRVFLKKNKNLLRKKIHLFMLIKNNDGYCVVSVFRPANKTKKEPHVFITKYINETKWSPYANHRIVVPRKKRKK